MFEGINSVGSNSPINETEQDRDLREAEQDDNIAEQTGSIAKDRRSSNSIEEIEARLQDIENRLPAIRAPNSNDTEMAFLPITATLLDVISAVNELIKRNVRRT